MIQTLKILWNKYRILEWWKKVLLFLPLLIAVIFVCSFTFWKPSFDSEQFENSVRHAKKQVNLRITNKIQQEQKLVKQDKELIKQQEILEEEIKSHEEKATNIVDAINLAAANNDLEHLRRIHKELNANRGDSTS